MTDGRLARATSIWPGSFAEALKTPTHGPEKGARAYMIRTIEWKYILYEGFPSQLFHLSEDPQEQNDLGEDIAYSNRRAELHERLFCWLRNRRQRSTLTHREVESRTGNAKERGFLFGVW